MIAEDAAVMREGLVQLLTERGHQVCAAVADGPALLEAAAVHRPDVAIVDIRMPPGFTDEGLREVLALMAEGRSNAAIAQLLVVSLGAVEKHVAGIFGKLGLEQAGSDNRRVLAVPRFLGT